MNRSPESLGTWGLVVVAGGSGRRMGSAVPKPFLESGGMTILERSLRAFSDLAWLVERVLVVPQASLQTHLTPALRERFAAAGFRTIVAGGARRQDSVLAGLRMLPQAVDRVLVHDGVRPLVTSDEITRVAAATSQAEGAVLGTRVKDTIKLVDNSGRIKSTPDRSSLWAVQTPQAAHRKLLQDLLESSGATEYTDEMSVLEGAGFSPFVIEGSNRNIKITTPEDLILVETLCKSNSAHR